MRSLAPSQRCHQGQPGFARRGRISEVNVADEFTLARLTRVARSLATRRWSSKATWMRSGAHPWSLQNIYACFLGVRLPAQHPQAPTSASCASRCRRAVSTGSPRWPPPDATAGDCRRGRTVGPLGGAQRPWSLVPHQHPRTPGRSAHDLAAGAPIVVRLLWAQPQRCSALAARMRAAQAGLAWSSCSVGPGDSGRVSMAGPFR